jgi:hypothetical protein
MEEEAEEDDLVITIFSADVFPALRAQGDPGVLHERKRREG